MFTNDSLFGHYQIHELLGSGAMGQVYRALDTRLDRDVALKIIREELGDAEGFRSRLAEEAKAAARIDSLYVVRVWEYACIDNTPYVAMEYVSGQDLREAIDQFDLDRKLRVGLQIGEGICAAHAAGLIHGDLKPDNVRLGADGIPKILDFGLAKPAKEGSVNERGEIAGSLSYLAPEQLIGGQPTYAGDLFAWGVLLYEMITGSRPFEGSQPASVAYAILHESPVSMREISPEVPQWLDSFVLKLVAKRPQDRFGSAAEAVTHFKNNLAGDLQPSFAGLATRAKSITVIDLKNLSGEESWDYFCQGFTEDLISALSRRTDLVVSAQPSSDLPRNMHEAFLRYRTDFVASGSLTRWGEKIQLRLSIYADQGNRLVSIEKYETESERLLEMLADAALKTAAVLEHETGIPSRVAEENLSTDISAYDYYLQGKSYYQTNKPEALQFARSMFEKALSIDPRLALAHTGLADLFVFQYNFYYDRTPERMEAAKAQALKALQIAPALPEAHRSLGRYHMFMGELEQAKACFLKAVELNPKYAIGYRTLGWLKYQEREFEASMSWAERALQLAPTDIETLLLIGFLHTYGKEYTAATVTLQRAVEIAPDYGRAYFNLGLVYMKMGILDPAIEHFETACKYEGDPNCYVDKGWALFIRKDYDAAREAFQKSRESGFFEFIANVCSGFLENACGNAGAASEHFTKAVASLQKIDYSDKENVQMQGYYALALIGAGEIDTARQQLDDILENDDLIGDVLYNVARCYALLGEKREAQMYLRQALIVSPGPTEKEVALDPHFVGLLY